MALLVVGSIGLLMWNWAMSSVRAFPASNVPVLASERGSSYPTGFLEEARDAVAVAPLDQRRLNALYVFEVRRAPNAQHTGQLLALLAKLGWRETAAQQNLLAASAAKENIAEVVARADGLLRRKRLEAEMIDVLHLIEVDPASRKLLIPALERWPNWRTAFFADEGDLADAERLRARASTISNMLSRGQALESREVAPPIQRMIAAGQLDGAYSLWLQSRHLPRKTIGLTDTDFRYASGQWEKGNRGFVPFEWQLLQGQGFETTAERAGGSSDVRISWDGLNAPIFLRQRFKVHPGHYAIKIQGLDAKPELLRHLVFMAECPGKFITFDRPESARPGDLSLAGDDAIDCPYPELRVAAQLRQSHTGFELSLSSIALAPARNGAM